MSLETQFEETKPGYHEVQLSGRLDTTTYSGLEEQLKGLLQGEAKALRIDMAKLDYISSMGLRVLLYAFKELRKREAHLLMVNLQPQIQKVFDIAAALPPETMFASVAEADAYLDAMQRKVLEEGMG